jgi:hypothetical protein
MDVFFFRLTNWLVVMAVASLVGGALVWLCAKVLFKRRISFVKCFGVLLAASIVSPLSQFALVLGLSASKTYIEPWITGVASVACGMFTGVLLVARCRDADGVRMGFSRALAAVILGVGLPVAALAAVEYLRG